MTCSRVSRNELETTGFEIVEHTETRCIIKAVSKEIEAEFETLLRRTFLSTIEMSRGIVDAITKKEYLRMAEIRNMEKTTNTFTDFCKQVLSKGSYRDPENTIYRYILVRDLEKIADAYKRICDVFGRNSTVSISLSRRTVGFVEKTSDFFELFYSLFYKFDAELLERFKSDGKGLLALIDNLPDGGSREENRIVSNLAFAVMTTYDMIGPYFILRFGKD